MLDEGHIESINHGQANDLLDPAFAQFRDQTRFWIQRVAVPLIMVVGLFGNLVTVIIMTRRRMRSTTNMYLAALAFVDMLYLVLTFLLGLSHYPNMAGRKYYIYWTLRPFLMMLTDACSNTSVWLTVTFTIERFIAVKYPMKGKVWCTEARAKRLILCVFLFAILFALPVPFEWKVIEKPIVATTAKKAATNQAGNEASPKISSVPKYSITASSSSSPSPADQQPHSTKLTSVARNELAINQIEDSYIMSLEYSDFGKNETYKTMYYWSTAVIFYFIPLLSLTFFNGFLIRSVHRSRRERNKMTSQRSIVRRPESKKLTDKIILSSGRDFSSYHETGASDYISNNEDACGCKSSANQSKSNQKMNLRRHHSSGMSFKTDRERSSLVPEDTIYEEQNGTNGHHFDSTLANLNQRYPISGMNTNHKTKSSMKASNGSSSSRSRSNNNNRQVYYSSQVESYDRAITTNESTIRETSRQVDFRFADKLDGPHNVRTNCDKSEKGELLEQNSTSDLCQSTTTPISKAQSVIMSIPFSINASPSNQLVTTSGTPASGPITGLDFSRDNKAACNTIEVPIQSAPDISETRLHNVDFSSNFSSSGTGGFGGGGGGGSGIVTNQTTSVIVPVSTQERRITIMLIAVVILFLFCQIPSAAMLLYTSVHETIPNTNEHALLLAFGNIFNFLMAVNAAGNFILYSFLSKKYRRTFVILFCSCLWSKDDKAYGRNRSQRGYISSSSSGCYDESKRRSTSIRFARPPASSTANPSRDADNSPDFGANQESNEKKRRETLA